MRRYALPLLALLNAFPAVLEAQTGYSRVHDRMLEEAKLLLGMEDHVEAAKIYRRLEQVDTAFAEVQLELGLCYSQMPQMREHAALRFERAVRLGDEEALYHLGLARHRQQRFDEAIDLLHRYRALPHRVMDDQEVDEAVAMCERAKRLTASPVRLVVRNLGPLVNSPDHDYCPLLTADGSTLYFTSRREGTTGGLKDPNGQWFEDIYMATRAGGQWGAVMNAGAPLNTALQDATVGLSGDGASMVIYRTGRDLVSGDLFESRGTGSGWGEPELMTSRINGEHHEPSATLSPDGSEIYFTSDRPEGFGGRDLYRIRRMPGGAWSQPMNLGSTINTAADEDAPFLHIDGTTLFFSSNGHGSMGGYDIFRSVLVDADMGLWSQPENMGHPLNTVNDDIYFCLNAEGTTGYFSSEREGGIGAQDIHEVVFPSSRSSHAIVRGSVVDELGQPLQARITLEDMADGEVAGLYNTTPATGRYLMVLEPGRRYRLLAEAEGHAMVEELLQAGSGDELIKEIQMLPIERLSGTSHHAR